MTILTNVANVLKIATKNWKTKVIYVEENTSESSENQIIDMLVDANLRSLRDMIPHKRYFAME